MATAGAIGGRIRERRGAMGLKQVELARRVGISASYLNLIEHNRRRIAGRVLTGLARALEVEPGWLAEGAETAAVAALREAAAQAAGEAGPEPETAEAAAFAERYPGWAALIAGQGRRIEALERTVAELSDRLAHDPHLSASLHEVLSTVTAIRSTASILNETPEIDPAWRSRFHRNMFEDSKRLADGSRALVDYLDRGAGQAAGPGSPREEVERWLEGRGYHLPELERALAPAAEEVVAGAGLTDPAARAMATVHLARYRADAERMPLAAFAAALDDLGPEPLGLAARFAVDPAAAMRRLAALPSERLPAPVGLVVCDGSGTLGFRRPVDGFPMPRLGAACPLWPLYRALAAPMRPLRALVAMPGARQARFLAHAVALPAQPADYDAPPVHVATMLLVGQGGPALPRLREEPVGSTCRVCPREACPARREPSILAA